jgi:hypothetical protein
MQKTLTKRLKALEKRTAEIREAELEIAPLAFFDMRDDDLLVLLSAYRAEREGRALTEGEATAQKRYYTAVKERYEWKKIRPPTDLARLFDIRLAITMAIGDQCGLQCYDSAVGYERALKEGRAPTEQECAAHQVWDQLVERLCQKAGFTSWDAVVLELGPSPWEVDDDEPR